MKYVTDKAIEQIANIIKELEKTLTEDKANDEKPNDVKMLEDALGKAIHGKCTVASNDGRLQICVEKETAFNFIFDDDLCRVYYAWFDNPATDNSLAEQEYDETLPIIRSIISLCKDKIREWLEMGIERQQEGR